MGKLTEFAKGIIIGLCVGIIIAGLAAGLLSRHKKDKELIEYAEKQQAIEALREDYGSRGAGEFLDGNTGIRRAADGAAAEFDRNRDEALQRFRSRHFD